MNSYRLKPFKHLFIFFSAVIFLSACSAVKKLNESDHLLNKNIIKIDLSELREQASSIIKQKPNRKILGVFRFHLGIYNLANTGKETKFKNWVKRTIGEAPVLLDTMLTEKSREQLEIFMQNKGYFKATVTDSIIYKPRKKANVEYVIKSGSPYLIRNIRYQIADEAMEKIVMADTANNLIKRGNNCDQGVMQKERDRINTVLKNKGYYFFNQQYISFSLDTNLQSYQADVYLLISKETSNPQDDTVSVKTGLPFQPYTIRKVYIQTDYDPIGKHDLVPHDSLISGDYTFMYSTLGLLYKPGLLLRHVFIKPGAIFRQADLEETYRHLQDLENFKFINIKYSLAKDTALTAHQLNCDILLTPSARHDYKLEGQVTYSGGNYGGAGIVSYRNKNTFKGSELFEFRIKGGLEKQILIADTTLESQTHIPFFNTYEIGPEISLAIPRFLIPFHLSKEYVYSNPTTNFTSAYNVQQRLEFKRTLANLSYSYSWKQSARIRHFVYPAEISFVKVFKTPAFRKKLDDFNDAALSNIYKDQLITNGRYAIIYNNQDLYKSRSHTYIKLNLEFAGNSIWAVNRIQKRTPENGENFTIFSVPFTQYFRPDIDVRYYQVFSRASQLVYRVAGGIGLAYENSSVMPFEKSFYAGGANDLRAWKARRLGPGSYSNNEQFEKTGELKLNGNLEYRFDIFRKLKGATFIDAGNIWLVKPDDARPGAEFKRSTFADQIAIGGGIGLRFDFTFFIIRLDAAQKLKDPSKEPGDRWVIAKNKLKGDTQINFGIGYPF